jgi:iron complex outermembrane receptor protein
MFVRAAIPILLASSVATSANAQVSEQKTVTPVVQDDDEAVGDIIVTAQRKSENLQRVPIAITAMNAEMLDNKGIDGLANIGSAVPGLSADQGAGILFVHLRGVGTVANGPGIENQIAMYVDGVYYGTQGVGLAKFNNVERVEVLKGPQGTLFGRNATGGLIHIITRDPSSTFTANGSASYGNYNAVDAKLYVSGPLSPDLAADFGATFGRHDGYGTNRLLDTPVDGVKHDVSVRSKLLYSPGASKFTLIGDYSDHKGTDNTERAFRGFRGPGEAAPVILPNRWDSNTDFANSLRIKSGGVSLKSEFGIST